MTDLSPGYDLESALPVIAVEPLSPPSRALIHLVTFKAFYTDLRKAAYGDYKLTLGIPHDQKDLAWELSNYDGRMLEVRIQTLAKVGSNGAS